QKCAEEEQQQRGQRAGKGKYQVFFFFQAEDGIRCLIVTGVQTCALPICRSGSHGVRRPPAGLLPSRFLFPRWMLTEAAIYPASSISSNTRPTGTGSCCLSRATAVRDAR